MRLRAAAPKPERGQTPNTATPLGEAGANLLAAGAGLAIETRTAEDAAMPRALGRIGRRRHCRRGVLRPRNRCENPLEALFGGRQDLTCRGCEAPAELARRSQLVREAKSPHRSAVVRAHT